MNKTINILIFIIASSLLMRCGNSSETASVKPAFLQIVDSYNRNVTIKKEPTKIISLSPGITEIIFLLHGENKLVGITEFCNYPEETKKIENVGGIQNVNVEKLLSLSPDLVVITSIVTKDIVKKIEEMNIPVIAIKEEDKIDGLFSSISIIGKILNKESLSDSINHDLRHKLEYITSKYSSNSNRPKICYIVDFGETGDFTAPEHSLINDIITIAGGENIGKGLKNWNISREFLFNSDPHYIFVRKEKFDYFCKLYPYSLLSAVKNHRVFPIESDFLDIVSPRNLQAIEYIAEIINKYQ